MLCITSRFADVCKTLFITAHFCVICSFSEEISVFERISEELQLVYIPGLYETSQKIFLDLDVYKATAGGLKLYAHLNFVILLFNIFILLS